MAQQGDYRFLLRMPEELRRRLVAAAESSGRSLNREIVDRLDESLAGAAQTKGEILHMNFKRKRTAGVLVAIAAALIAVVAGLAATSGTHHGSPFAQLQAKLAAKDMRFESQGTANGGSGGESAELMAAMQQFDNARTAPSGIVAPGGYSAAFNSLQNLPTTGAAWDEVTNVPYDADDPDYRDYYSNSSGGSGNVTGRITGIAADNHGDVYAGGANGGVWRSTTGGGDWSPIADSLPSLSTGDLELASDGSLWYATGEANTGGTSYAGTGIYRLANPTSGSFTPDDRVGGDELESTTINSIRFTKDAVWAATLRGIYSHPLGDYSTPWTLRFAPNPSYLPGGANAGIQNAAYMNIVNDIAIDPAHPNHMLAAIGWRSGASYNGFYESTDGGNTWNKVNPTGALDPNDVGYANFAYSADGKKLYVVNQSPRLLNKLTGTVNSYLDGIYVSNNGNPAGPWSKIADSQKLANSGSALKQAVGGKGYGPGIQAWYNQFIAVDPNNANHIFAGLEEVYESNNGGSNWNTIGPYWNFYFSCWAPDSEYPPDVAQPNRCPQTTHSDQHSVAIGSRNGVPTLFVGNDGGIYSRPLNGSVDRNGNATDWTSLNDGTIDALQYYYVGAGKLADNRSRPDLTTGDDVLVSGGMQDNGGSLIRPGDGKMVSNFGGDGGDVLVDPNNGCNIVQEYVYLTMEVTKTCANPGPDHPNAFLDPSDATTVAISPPDINAQFIAPFTANDKNINQWVAAGNSLWYQDQGFNITSGSQWQKIYTLPSAGQTFTAVAYSGNSLLATWCGPCSNSGTAPFTRGAVVGTFDPITKSWTVNPIDTSALPNRYFQGAAINPNDSKDMFIGINGFSRRYTEGPGVGFGHVFESKDSGATWTDISGTTLPDIPVNDVVSLSDGGLAVATDLGVVYRAPGSTDWTRLGSGLPTTTVMDLSVGPDGNLYAGTHGRGIWRVKLP